MTFLKNISLLICLIYALPAQALIEEELTEKERNALTSFMNLMPADADFPLYLNSSDTENFSYRNRAELKSHILGSSGLCSMHLDLVQTDQANAFWDIERRGQIFDCLKDMGYLHSLLLKNFVFVLANGRSLDSALLSLRKLRCLKLINCELTSMPHLIVALPDLKKVSLAHNHIGSVPKGLFKLQIEELDLSDNCITLMPGEVTDAKMLQYLNLEDNPLVCFVPKGEMMGAICLSSAFAMNFFGVLQELKLSPMPKACLAAPCVTHNVKRLRTH